ncbi:MAG: hypothetical protein EZS28_003295 [Streblomastix strix]|uniref:Uncharacterized protein n=1 Tax=Streblomastix strix TaxID=222440 RepID=A0A5J4X1H2_9EUKA|nr:MAG: hypothetical protein EZS28_003295 [Streblomastix strix]
MKKNYICEELAIVLETSFVDPQTVDFLIRLQRTAERKGQKEQVELIKEGLMQMLSQEIEKATQKNVKDGVIYLVGDIVLELSDNNPEACKMIIQETDFIDKYISYLNSLSKSQIKNWHGYYFTTLSDNLPSEDQNLLFEKGVIQTIVNLDFKDKECSLEYFKIESSIIEAENQRLKDGEQHPYMKQLSEDGTLTKILQAFINEKNEDKQRILMNSLGSLYKAAPLPIDTQKLIIDFLRKEKKFEIMSYLAECPSNHDTILMNDYEQKFFQKSLTEMHSIRIIYSIIKYGNEINKKKVSAAVKEEYYSSLARPEQYLQNASLQFWTIVFCFRFGHQYYDSHMDAATIESA